MTLTGKQKRHLRSLGHDLRPCLQVGKAGVTENTIKQIDDSLTAHELVKVNLRKAERPERQSLSDSIAEATQAELVQIIGCMVLFFRQNRDPKKRKIRLPKP